MNKWYHCIKCNYYWESNEFYYECPQCNADAYIMLKMDSQSSRRLMKFFELLETDQRRKEWQNTVTTNKKSRIQLQDRRGEIEKLYKESSDDIRRIIEESVKHTKVNGNNSDLLKAQISDDGIIEIINDNNGKIVLWSYLTDTERWSFWQYFNKLLDEIKVLEKSIT